MVIPKRLLTNIFLNKKKKFFPFIFQQTKGKIFFLTIGILISKKCLIKSLNSGSELKIVA